MEECASVPAPQHPRGQRAQLFDDRSNYISREGGQVKAEAKGRKPAVLRQFSLAACCLLFTYFLCQRTGTIMKPQ